MAPDSESWSLSGLLSSVSHLSQFPNLFLSGENLKVLTSLSWPWTHVMIEKRDVKYPWVFPPVASAGTGADTVLGYNALNQENHSDALHVEGQLLPPIFFT